jgi:hypothetical protein
VVLEIVVLLCLYVSLSLTTKGLYCIQKNSLLEARLTNLSFDRNVEFSFSVDDTVAWFCEG